VSEGSDHNSAHDEETPSRSGAAQGDDAPEREIKVTDRRMFTAEGELREEYRHIEDAATRSPAAEPPGAAAEEGAAAPPRQPQAPAPPPPAADTPRGAPVEIPSTGAGPAPSFYDLLGMIAEPVAIYLGDATLPDGRSAEDLEMARLHIDLLDVLRQKTAGNLSVQESSVLEDVLYRLRMRYVQKRG
jgi:hypothetical protein